MISLSTHTDFHGRSLACRAMMNSNSMHSGTYFFIYVIVMNSRKGDLSVKLVSTIIKSAYSGYPVF